MMATLTEVQRDALALVAQELGCEPSLAALQALSPQQKWIARNALAELMMDAGMDEKWEPTARARSVTCSTWWDFDDAKGVQTPGEAPTFKTAIRRAMASENPGGAALRSLFIPSRPQRAKP